MSKEIEEAMHQRDRLVKARKHEEFKKQRNKVTSLLRASKKHFQNLVASDLIASKSQVTIKELPPDKLNNHFANVSDSVFTNDKPKLNDLK